MYLYMGKTEFVSPGIRFPPFFLNLSSVNQVSSRYMYMHNGSPTIHIPRLEIVRGNIAFKYLIHHFL